MSERGSGAEPDGILDTSVVISLEDRDPSTLPAFPTVSAVTLAEVARAYDALIAATAISRGLPLYTLNPADFADIGGLSVRVPERAAGSDPLS